MPDQERPRLRPVITHNVSASGHDYGHEIAFERIHDDNVRASAHTVGELTIEDLETLRYQLDFYLDEGQFQE